MSSVGPSPWTKRQAETIRSCVQRLVESEAFSQATRMRRFMRFLADHTLAGGGDTLNQYAIALAVFDRDEDFDPTTDAIVRVEAGRLRGKLREYYEREGAGEVVRIQLAKRGYTLSFEWQESPSRETIDAPPPASTRHDPVHAHDVVSQEPTVAVLPFVNMSSDPEQDYFSDGIAEDLITDLSRLEGLAVVARQSSFSFRDKAVGAVEICRELGADLIVEGSVRKIGSHVRFNVQLIDGASGKHVFAERFDYPADDVFALQVDVNQRLLDALKPYLALEHQAVSWRRPTDSTQAHDLVMRGIRVEEAGTREALLRARRLFEQAAEIDPAYVAPLVRLSLNVQRMWLAAHSNDHQPLIAEASRFATRAVELDTEDASARAARCWARLWQSQHDEAIEDGVYGVGLAPNNVVVRERLAFVLAGSRRGDEGLEHLQHAMTLNPLHAYHFPRGLCFYGLGRFEAALEQFQASVTVFRRFVQSRVFLIATLHRLGREPDATDAARDLLGLSPSFVPRAPELFFRHSKDQALTMGAVEAALRGAKSLK